MIHTSTIKWFRHIRLVPMVVASNVQPLIVNGRVLCVFVWETTISLAVNRWSPIQALTVFGLNETQTSTMK